MIILTEEQVLIQNMAREFANTTVLTKTIESYAEYAKTGLTPFAHNCWEDMAELGFAGISIPEEYGGMGLGIVEKCIVLEELAKVNTAVASNLDAHTLCMNAILYSGTEEQKQKYLKLGAEGKFVTAAGVTDPAGSSNYPEWAITVEEKDDHFVLNGTKFFVTNSIAADLYAVFTKSNGENGPMDCYLVEKGYAGLETGQLESFGKTGTNTGTIHLKNVKVPKENKLPPTDLVNAKWLALGYLDAASIYLGKSQSTLDRTLAFTKQRSRNGKPLAQLQAVAHRFANMTMEIECDRAIIYTAAQSFDAGHMNRKLHSIAKIHASETLASVGLQCTTLHGAAGLDPATGVLDTLMIGPGAMCGEGPNDMHRDMIAQDLGIVLDSLIKVSEF